MKERPDFYHPDLPESICEEDQYGDREYETSEEAMTMWRVVRGDYLDKDHP